MSKKVICRNKKARHDYFIEETYEAGMSLKGTEVKSLRQGRASLGDAYAVVENREVFLKNSRISEYPDAVYANHEPQRNRKLLLQAREIKKLTIKILERGYTLVPLELYFNDRGLVKVLLGLGKGKRKYDKRHEIAKRDANRDMQRVMRERTRDR